MGTPLGDHNRWGLRSLDTRPWECWISRSMVGLRVGRRAGLRVGPLLDSTKHHKRPPAPLYKSAWTRGLRQRVLLAPGPSVLARQTVTATRQLVVWWPRLSEDTGAGGLTPSVLVVAPTIRTHCVRRWGQRPELLGHQFWPRRTGRWHRAEGLSLWTPTGWVTIE